MKTSTKVIIKFQLFSSIVLLLVLIFVNILFFKAGIEQYNKKIDRLPKHHGMGKNNLRPWTKLNENCFFIYGKKHCISHGEKNLFGFYHIEDKFFYIKNGIVFDASDYFYLQKKLVYISIFIFTFYILISYLLGILFLRTIFSKVNKAVNDLKTNNFIELNKMNLEKNDELYLLFNTINKQIEDISSFNKYLSHEIKTPLMNISSSLDILELKNNINLSGLKNEIKRIKNIIDSLNKLIFIENKNFNIKLQDFNICDYLKKFNLKLECKTNIIKTNPELFEILLQNLINNAKKYSKGEIKVIVDKNYLEISNPSDNINNIDKLTDKFYKEGKNGLGIGLFLVKTICEILKYKLEIKYEEGVFRVKMKI